MMTNHTFPLYFKWFDENTEDEFYCRIDKCDHHGWPFVEDRIILSGDWQACTNRYYCASLQVFPKAEESSEEEFQQARKRAIDILWRFA